MVKIAVIVYLKDQSNNKAFKIELDRLSSVK